MDGITIRENVPLAPQTTLKVGGAARFFVSVTTVPELVHAISFAKEKSLPIFILGGGSNILVDDGGFSGLVIKIDIRGVSYEEKGDTVFITVAAGESWDALVADTVSRGLWGIENLSGIPGTVGAAPIQNIGAYGTEIENVIEHVHVFDRSTGEEKHLTREQCSFAYRDSIFKHEEGARYVVTAVTLRLSRTPTPNISYKDLTEYFKNTTRVPTLQEIRDAVLSIRAKKFPNLRMVGTAGSFFKNPIISSHAFTQLRTLFPDVPGFPTTDGRIKVPLGWIFDHGFGLRGHREGNVSLFEQQALVLVANEGATAREVSAFAERITATVKEKIKIDIEWEVRTIVHT